MKHSDALSKDARALLRAARGGDDISAAERQRVLHAFRERVALDDATADATASAPRPRAARVSRSRRRRPLPRPVKRAAWALAAVIASGSLAAFAHEGAFAGWGTAIARMLSTLSGESSSAEPAVKDRGARGVPAASTPEQQAPPASTPQPMRAEQAPVAEHTAAADVPAKPAAEPSATQRTTEPAVEDRAATGGASASSAPIEAPRPHLSRAPSGEPARRGTSELPVSHAESPAADRSTSTSTSTELDLIITARNALGEKRHADARAAAERHALQFPAGAFGEERDAILALCACRESGARERARVFIERRPESLFAERIRRDCKLTSNSVPGTPSAGTHQESPPRSGTR